MTVYWSNGIEFRNCTMSALEDSKMLTSYWLALELLMLVMFWQQ